jgi:glutamate-1-semialdehyde 2,1-aminomutase
LKGGAQSRFSVKPDITCLSKILGGGFPVGAYGARRQIMTLVSPEGPVYQAGTLSGNPVAMTAGLVTISHLNSKAYSKLEQLSSMLEQGLLEAATQAHIAATINRVGSMIGLFFGNAPIKNFADVKETNTKLYPIFHRAMLESGVYLPPSPFETIFLSTAHTTSDIHQTVDSAKKAFRLCSR